MPWHVPMLLRAGPSDHTSRPCARGVARMRWRNDLRCLPRLTSKPCKHGWRLSRHASLLAALVERSQDELHTAETIQGEWAPAEIRAHSRASCASLSSRAYMILVRDNPRLSAFDERRCAEVAGYTRQKMCASLQAYTLLREGWLPCCMPNRAALGPVPACTGSGTSDAHRGDGRARRPRGGALPTARSDRHRSCTPALVPVR